MPILRKLTFSVAAPIQWTARQIQKYNLHKYFKLERTEDILIYTYVYIAFNEILQP